MNSPFKCPTCKKPVAEPDKFDGKIVFPFCSERCKLVDLGRWLDGKYQIPVDADVDTADDDFTTPPGFEISFDSEFDPDKN